MVSYSWCKVCSKITGGGDFCSLDCYGKYRKDPETYDKKKHKIKSYEGNQQIMRFPIGNANREYGGRYMDAASEWRGESLTHWRTRHGHGENGE